MVSSTAVISPVILVLLQFIEGFAPYCDWVLTKYTGGAIKGFPNIQNSGLPSLSSDDGSDFSSAVSCGSLYMSHTSWSLQADFNSLISDPSMFTIGFWVNFESTIGNDFFFFGTDPESVRASSSTEGQLILKYYSSSDTTDSANDLAVTVPRNKWLFLTFNIKDWGQGSVMEEVAVLGHKTYSKTANGGEYFPTGNLKFGKGIKAKFYEVLAVEESFLNDDLIGIYLLAEDGTFFYARPCSGDCADAQCTFDGKCISKLQLCTSCPGGSCTVCSEAGRDPSSYCNSCNAGFAPKNGICKLVCAAANNCDSCLISSTICDSCPANYFLYKASATSTSCICNFYLACADSCTNCSPGPNCYLCADSVFLSGNTCEVSKVGYQLSFNYPNIILSLAYPLSSALEKHSFTASTTGGAAISTATWSFTGCAAGSVQCTIGTNLKLSDLPIELEIEFDQA